MPNTPSIGRVPERALTSESAVSLSRADPNAPGLADAVHRVIPERYETPPEDLWFRRRIELRAAIPDVWRFRELILSLAERDYRARYKQSVLGVAWAMLTPVLLMVVFTVVFTRTGHISTGGAPYVLFSYIGLIPWTFFSNSVSSGGQSIVSNLSIVNKVSCPREVFPLATTVVAALDTAIASVVLLLLFAVTRYPPRIQTLYVPIPLMVLLVYTVGLTVTVAGLLVYLRDLRHILPLAIQIGLFLTPVAYGIEVIAHSRTTQMVYSLLNPVAPVIDSLRRNVLYGMAPDWGLLGMGSIGAFLALIVGYVIFKRLEVGIADIA
jgi:ABC-2 type transport system permease protein/lipopolysaccharide transport system permease protein